LSPREDLQPNVEVHRNDAFLLSSELVEQSPYLWGSHLYIKLFVIDNDGQNFSSSFFFYLKWEENGFEGMSAF
jgi:hypothetical protein